MKPRSKKKMICRRAGSVARMLLSKKFGLAIPEVINKISLSFILLFYLSPVRIYADSLFLRTGKSLEGNVISQNMQSLTFREAGGKLLTVSKKEILKIRYGRVEKVERKESDITSDPTPGLSALESRRSLLNRDELVWSLMHRDYMTSDMAEDISENDVSGESDSLNQEGIPVLPGSGIGKGSIILRNMVLPGLGHVSAGYDKEGYGAGGLFTLSGLIAVNQYTQYRNLERSYRKKSEALTLFGMSPAMDTFTTDPLKKLYILWNRESEEFRHFQKSTYSLNLSTSLTGIIYASILIRSLFLNSPPLSVLSDAGSRGGVSVSLTILPDGQHDNICTGGYFSGSIQFQF